MKKLILIASLVLIGVSFNGCSTDLSNNEDAVLTQQIIGKWKLTEAYSDAGTTPISNGYEIEFKDDNKFISNEENGFTGGTYKVINSPGKNLQLIYKKSWEAKLVYKYINSVYDQNIFIQGSTSEATQDGSFFLGGYVLTRIP